MVYREHIKFALISPLPMWLKAHLIGLVYCDSPYVSILFIDAHDRQENGVEVTSVNYS
jgi:hypothetical protein